MANLTAEQASDLANDFLGLAQAIGDYRYHKWNELSEKENWQLAKMQWSVLNYGEDISALSTTLVLDDIAKTLSNLDKITAQIMKSINTLNEFKNVMNLAIIIVSLGGAIVSKRPDAALNRIEELSNAWNG